MNYYEHHIGDYIKDTAHLTMLEDAAYRRLIDAYYTRETPLPADRKSCHKLARALSREERAAVDYVLDEFFRLDEDGWHQSRCDQELARYIAKKPEAEAKRENAKERQRRARERRNQLFEELSGYGINMPWNATTEQLQAELSRAKDKPVTPPVTRDDTATQTPVPSHQTPCIPIANDDGSSTGASPGEPQPAAVRFAVAIRSWEKARGKTVALQASDPRVQAWEKAGVTDEQLQLAYELAVAARETDGDPSPVNAGFLDTMLAKVLKPATGSSAVTSSAVKKAKPAPWYVSMSVPVIEEKAKELGLSMRPGEQFVAYRMRVLAAHGITDEMLREATEAA